MLGRRITKCGGRHGQDGAPVVAVWGCGAAACRRFPGVAVAAVRGFPVRDGAHRSTGYQRISASGHRLPATLRARIATETAPVTGPSPIAHSFGVPGLPGAAPRSSACVVSCSDTRCRARPAQRHHPPPVSTGTR
ncbi:conserved hypothetical protein [Streptomyces viridochromogenes DSM 40736]|uniref:Uncharacterized protein n=1 Tax=Streptomyces viridochromogenes (strain DSM 40736 / JCM 4977 / BCRC 1201 / Tue 494) TaxID=591159 RepID=D9WZG9_STRVT|nr:conserved hypothetical protein [Streptomyces viridochromogenes DSM 40736]